MPNLNGTFNGQENNELESKQPAKPAWFCQLLQKWPWSATVGRPLLVCQLESMRMRHAKVVYQLDDRQAKLDNTKTGWVYGPEQTLQTGIQLCLASCGATLVS